MMVALGIENMSLFCEVMQYVYIVVLPTIKKTLIEYIFLSPFYSNPPPLLSCKLIF